ncbi:MAG: AAA family ATPase [Deltaproteobacteria bacterium]|nr:AAA family ATPase [Deltaproteobacteria bacterium]
MDCPGCGEENRQGRRFCGECGVALSRTCSGCGAVDTDDARFCGECGAEFQTRSRPTTPASDREPRAYTPKHLADKILQSKSAIEGERKQVTVLFADVKGSTELAAELDPEEWYGISNCFLQILADGIHRFEGTVNQFTGDGVMALFGAPIAHEDHAQRACYAALQLRDELRRYGDEVKRTKGVALAFRIGLHSGEVVVGKIGDDLRMDYTAAGLTTNLADRMQKLADPGTIYVSEHTGNFIEGYFRLRDLGEFELKGLPDPIRVHELEGVGEFRTRFDVSRARGLTRFVGREQEMAVLEAALERARAGQGQIVGIVAEAGTGKSRLTYQFGEQCRALGVTVVTDSCPPYGNVIPLRQPMAIQRSFFGITGEDSPEAARNKIAAGLSRLDPALAEHIPFAMDFLGVAEPGKELPQMEPEVRQREFLRYYRQTARSVGLTVSLVEDVQWIDPASEAVSLEVSRIQQDHPRLSVMNFRPEYRPPQAEWPNYEEIRLKPLTAESTAELLADLLGPEATNCGLEPLIQERAAGNPFFVEEIVQSLAESGALEGTRGAYRVADPVDTIEVPSTVKAVLEARIDRLGEREKHILQSASVIGKEFSESILASIAGLPETDLASGLSALRSADLLYELSLYPEAEYAFKHPLAQEVAYDSQLSERRKRGHAEAARALEELHADKLDERAALLAHHWEQAGDAHQALRWHERAAQWVQGNDYSAADRHWRRVRALAQGLPESDDAGGAQVRACWRVLALGVAVGISRDEARALFDEGTTVASAHDDRAGLTLLEISYAHIRGLHDEFPEMLDHATRAARLAERLDNIVLRVEAAQTVMRPLQWMGRLREGQEVCDQALELVEDNPDLFVGSPFTRAELLHQQGIFLTSLGRPREGLAVLERAIALVRRLGIERRATSFYTDAVVATSLLGDSPRSLDLAHRAVVLAEEHGGASVRGSAQFALLQAKILNREWVDTLEVAGRIRSIVEETQIGLEMESLALLGFSEAHLGLGDLAAAREAAEKAVALTRSHGLRLIELWGVSVLSQAVLAEGESSAAEAESLLGRLAQLVEQTGARSFKPQLSEGRAGLARIRGDERGCEQHLREAHRLYTEMGATAHAERVAGELAALPN